MLTKTLAHGLLAVAVSMILPTDARSSTSARPIFDHAQDDAADQDAASVADLIKGVDIRHDTFTLANGLTVIVVPDPLARQVSVNVIYKVGSTSEPAGRTGFAHLFEHLMFNGSENWPGKYNQPLERLGAQVNGATKVDRTSYYEIVPTAGLEQALFLESDRMGYLLGALTQRKLDEQRAVVQNEKRQGENRPLALVGQRIDAALYPAGHPHAHSIIGSMADLDAASLDDVRAWFRSHYRPGNAILALAGDIDVATAHVLVEKYFGVIPAGSPAPVPVAPVPTLSQRIDDTTTDRVSAPKLYRAWAIPGQTDPDAVALRVASGVMGGMKSSPLKQRLVERDKLFTGLAVSVDLSSQGGTFSIEGSVAPGVDPAIAGRRLDGAVAQFLETGTTFDEIERYTTGIVAGRLSMLDSLGGRVGMLTEGIRLGRGTDFYKQQLAALAAQTPVTVRDAARRWLERPVYALTVLPGPGPVHAEAAAMIASPPTAQEVAIVPGSRGGLPPLGKFEDAVLPPVEYARLSNGISVALLRRTGVPVTQVVLDFDAGTVSDPVDARGTQALVLALLDKGTRTRDAAAIARRNERLGATSRIDTDADRTTALLDVPSANLGPALDVLADVLRRPAFAPGQIETQRARMLADIAEEATDPGGRAARLFDALRDAGSPYSRRPDLADAKAVASLTRHDLVAFQHAWFRPEKATVWVVSDRSLATVRDELERRFGDWHGVGAAGVKDAVAATPAATSRILLVDSPGATQSIIIAGQRTSFVGHSDMLLPELANMVLGNGFSSRLNTDLREEKGWSYGVGGQFDVRALDAPYTIYAPVQSDRTGDAIAAIRSDIRDFLGDRPMTQAEFNDAVDGQIRSLSFAYSTARSYLDALRDAQLYGRPANYVATLAQRYRAMHLEQARCALRGIIDPDRLLWAVAGDAARVKPQLDRLGIPVEVIAETGDVPE